MTTTATDPWAAADYVPLARRPARPAAAPLAWVDPAAQRREEARSQEPVRRPTISELEQAARERERTSRAATARQARQDSRREGVRAWAGLVMAVAVAGFVTAAIHPLFDATARAGDAAFDATYCAAVEAVNAPVEGAVARQNEAFAASGVVEGLEDEVQLDTTVADALCGD
ncbi:MAG TPA: hypothetical protein VGC37_18710 [Friedmanniella sp.]